MNIYKKRFRHIFLLIIIVLSGVVGVFYFVFKNEQINSEVQPSLTPKTTENNLGKTYSDFYENREFAISVKIPESWTLVESTNIITASGKTQLSLNIRDNIPLNNEKVRRSYSNDLVIYNDARVDVLSTLEQASINLIDYTTRYNPGVSYHQPLITKISDTTIGGNKALNYEVFLGDTSDYGFDNNSIRIVHTINNGTLWSFEMHGNDQMTFDQILSTLEFLEQTYTFSSAGQSCGALAGPGGDAQCADGLSCYYRNPDDPYEIGTCVRQ